MRKFIQLKPGDKYGRLTLVSFLSKEGRCETWVAKCDCGTIKTVKKAKLISNRTTSCGCRKREVGRTHGMSNSCEFKCWTNMKKRCLNKNSKAYKHYGGRGITICKTWRDSFEAFYRDMGHKPKGYTLERVDNNGNYEPGNCKWANRKQQAKNRRVARLLTHNNRTENIADWSRITGLSTSAIDYRLKTGMTVSEALTTPKSVNRAYISATLSKKELIELRKNIKRTRDRVRDGSAQAVNELNRLIAIRDANVGIPRRKDGAK